MRIVGAEVWDPDSNYATLAISVPTGVGSVEDCHLFISSVSLLVSGGVGGNPNSGRVN